MSNTDNTLQEELQKEIQAKARAHWLNTSSDQGELDYIAGATEYAQKFQQAVALLEKVVFRHEGGLLPDMHIYNEIKSFLNGTK